MPTRKKSDEAGGLTFALQALLARHESYMADSEVERNRMADVIALLENDKRELQTANEKIVAENRELLDKLEDLNTTIANSDVHVKNLEATLAHAQLEVRRLTNLAARTENLERQLIEMENGRAEMIAELDNTREEKTTALSRWREAELKVRDMGQEVARIEAEARRETERHIDLVKRMERQRVVEKELESAAGRLKGSAAANALHERTSNKTVVSSFVKDILQDNANLQAGIVELRELLQASNEEVQNMREQVLEHQPLLIDDGQRTISMEDQLEWSTKPVSQEVHVHHHYHAKYTTPKTKATVVRRNSKKRAQVGFIGSTPDSTAPSTPQSRPSRYTSSSAVPAMSLYQPAPPRNRWSTQSATTGSSNPSSIPGSPQSCFDKSTSIFDRLEQATESRPTSPESAGFNSPGPEWQHNKGRPSDFSLASYDAMPEEPDDLAISIEDKGQPHTNSSEPPIPPPVDEDHDPMEDTVVLKCPDAETTAQKSPPEGSKEQQPPDVDSSADDPSQRVFHRTSSHDSLVSISGMDIHLAKRKPSQVFLLTRGISSNYFNNPSSPAKPVSAAQPLASIAEVTASSSRRAISSTTASSSSVALLSGLAATPTSSPMQSKGLGRLVGGWVRGNWGVAPMKSTTDLRSSIQPQSQTYNSGIGISSHTSPARPMGINQKGAIPGLRAPMRTPSEVHAKVVDTSLLSESLRE